MTYRSLFAILGLILTPCEVYAAPITCPEPPQQFSEEISGDATLELKGLFSRLVSGELTGDLRMTTEDVFSRYPNADRIILGQGIFSIYCQLIDGSAELSDEMKLQQVEKMSLLILQLANPPAEKKSEPVEVALSNEGWLDPDYRAIAVFSRGGPVFNIDVDEIGLYYIATEDDKVPVSFHQEGRYLYHAGNTARRAMKAGVDLSKLNVAFHYYSLVLRNLATLRSRVRSILRASDCPSMHSVLASMSFKITYDDAAGNFHKRFFRSIVAIPLGENDDDWEVIENISANESEWNSMARRVRDAEVAYSVSKLPDRVLERELLRVC